MDFLERVKQARTTRRYKQNPIGMDTLTALVECGVYSPSGANKQPLKYVIIKEEEQRNEVFVHIKWAGALKDWEGPEEGERPMAYILILLDTTISTNPGVDHGIAAQSIQLGASSIGLGCCMIGAFNKRAVKEVLLLPDNLEPLLLLALGEPAETVMLETHKEGQEIAYYRDLDGTHHVPKRTLDTVIWRQG